MRVLMTLTSLMFCAVFANDIVQIQVGKRDKAYSTNELKERIWRLESAVFQLQQKIIAIENGGNTNSSGDTWVCTIDGFKTKYSATGGSMAVAKSRAINECNMKETNSIHCGTPKCEQ